MIQLKKKVTRLKICHFLEKNKLVLFLHYNTQNASNQDIHAISKLLLSKEATNSLLIPNKIAQRLVLSQLSKSANAPSDAIEVKLNLVEPVGIKFLLETQQSLAGPTQIRQGGGKINQPIGAERQDQKERKEGYEVLFDPRSAKHFSKRKEEQECKEGKKERVVFSPLYLTNKRKNILFHGPSIFLGIIDMIRLVDVLKSYRQQGAFFLFGGLYKNQILSHSQVEKLARLSQKQENLLYSELIDCLKKPALQTLLTVQSCTSLSYLKRVQHTLIQIFNFRNNQLLMQSNL